MGAWKTKKNREGLRTYYNALFLLSGLFMKTGGSTRSFLFENITNSVYFRFKLKK